MIISKEKFDYPLEMMNDRKKFIDKETSENGESFYLIVITYY